MHSKSWIIVNNLNFNLIFFVLLLVDQLQTFDSFLFDPLEPIFPLIGEPFLT